MIIKNQCKPWWYGPWWRAASSEPYRRLICEQFALYEPFSFEIARDEKLAVWLGDKSTGLDLYSGKMEN